MIKMSIKNAKRLGFSIKGYVFTKEKNTPQPVIEKTKKRIKKTKNKTETIPFTQKGNVFKLNLKDNDNV